MPRDMGFDDTATLNFDRLPCNNGVEAPVKILEWYDKFNPQSRDFKTFGVKTSYGE